MSEKLSPFDIVKNINDKTGIFDSDSIKSYNSWMINKIFSFTKDTIHVSDEMNKYSFLDKDIQYAFYYHFLSKKKRWGKWQKRQEMSGAIIDALKKKYHYNNRDAEIAVTLLSEDEKKTLIKEFAVGGVNKKKES